MDLNRVYAHHMLRNPSSGRVLEKAGFQHEGILRQRVRKWGVYEDVAILAILKADWIQHPDRDTAASGAVQ
jgi:RimJ/RimL family protein N-acetyltransferase